jgi:hypothetical protein
LVLCVVFLRKFQRTETCLCVQKVGNFYGLRQRRKYILTAVRSVLRTNRYYREIKSANNMAVISLEVLIENRTPTEVLQSCSLQGEKREEKNGGVVGLVEAAHPTKFIITVGDTNET